jgi:hypothetical protein
LQLIKAGLLDDFKVNTKQLRVALTCQLRSAVLTTCKNRPLLQGLGWEVDFAGHDLFEISEQADDPPIGKLKKPRLVYVRLDGVFV